MLHLLRATPLAARYAQEPFPLLSREEYVSVVCGQLERLPPDTVVERLTGDGAADALIAPLWTRNKRAVLNLIEPDPRPARHLPGRALAGSLSLCKSGDFMCRSRIKELL